MTEAISPAELLPPARSWDRARVRRAMIAWAIAWVILLVLVRFDVRIMAAITGHPFKSSDLSMTLLRGLAEYAFITGLCVAILIFDRRRVVVVAHMLFAIYLGFNMMCLGKLFIHRVRPAHAQFERYDGLPWYAGWQGIDVDFHRAVMTAMDASMPSGHTFTVFAMAFTLGWFYPRLQIPMLILATGTACSRVLERMHWPSDCWAGAMVGYLSAWLSLRTRRLTQPARWFRR